MSYNLSNIIKRILKEDKETEDIQSKLRGNQDELDRLLAQKGLNSELGYIPLTSMVDKFDCTVMIKSGTVTIPQSWEGQKFKVEKNSVITRLNLTLLLSPNERKTITSGKYLDEYLFKVVTMNGTLLKNDYIKINGEEINVIDKRVNDKVIPNIRLDKKYKISWLGSKKTFNEGIVNEIVKTLLNENNNTIFDMELMFNSVDVKDLKRGEEIVDDNFKDVVKTLTSGNKTSINVTNFEIDKNQALDAIDKSKYKSEKEYINKILENLNGDCDIILNNRGNGGISIDMGSSGNKVKIFLNIPFNRQNGLDLTGIIKKMKTGGEFSDCGLAYAKPNDPIVNKGLTVKIRIK